MGKRKKLKATTHNDVAVANELMVAIDYEKLADCLAKAIAEESDKRINAYSITREWMKFIIAPVFWSISVLTAILAVGLVLNQLLIDSQDENEDKNEDQDQEENQDLLPEGRTTISDLRSWNIHAVMQEIVLDCFSETFADVEACIRLEATFADYILAFVFESWDLGEIGTPAYYRIPAVLKTCFPDALTPDKCALEDDAKKKLKEAIEALNAHGMPQDRISFDSLVEHLNHVLKTYTEKLNAEAQALEDYLQLCKVSYTKQEKGQMKPYREMFYKIRQLQLMKCESPQEEGLVGLHLFNALTGIKL